MPSATLSQTQLNFSLLYSRFDLNIKCSCNNTDTYIDIQKQMTEIEATQD